MTCHSDRWLLGNSLFERAFDGRLVEIDGLSPLEMVGKLVAFAGLAPLDMPHCWVPVRMEQGPPLELWHCLVLQGIVGNIVLG